MSLLPDTIIGQIEFCEEHLPIWTANATQIGLLPAQVTAFGTAVTAARTQYNAAVAARAAAKNQTANMHQKLDTMNGQCADLVRIIRAYANVQNDPNVYIKAEIPAPPTPQPVPAPGTPGDFTVSINELGAIRIDWKCANPTSAIGTVYEVSRRIGSPEESEFTFVGNTGKKFFEDTTLPSGSAGGPFGVTYSVTGVRSTLRGNPGVFTLTIGAGVSVNELTAGNEDENAMKMAA